MDKSTAIINNTHSEEITVFLESDLHHALPDLGLELGSILINQMGGDKVFLEAVENKASVKELKIITGLDDNAELQAIYTKHKDVLLSIFSRKFLADDLLVIHEHSHTRHTDNNLPRGVTFKIDDTAQGLYNPTIIDNTADNKFLEAARFVCRSVIEFMIARYEGFITHLNATQEVSDLLSAPLKVVYYDTYMPSTLTGDLTELLGGINRLIAESENLDNFGADEFYDEPYILSCYADVLPVFERNKEDILSMISEVATKNSFTSAFAFIDYQILGNGYNPDMVAEAYWSDTQYAGISSNIKENIAIGVVKFAALMLCRTINAYRAGFEEELALMLKK